MMMAEAAADLDDNVREVDYKYLQSHCKKLIATLPVFNNQGKLVQKIQKGVTELGKKAKFQEVLVGGVDTKLWPNWIVEGINPMLLSEAGLEAWYLSKTPIAFWHPRLFFYPLFKGPNKFKCPGCKSSERVVKDSFSRRSRAICGLQCTIYLVDYRYKCEHCPGK